MQPDRTELAHAFESVAAWCERYFQSHPELPVGHSLVTLLRVFGEMAGLPPAESVRRSLLNELAEARLQRLARGDLMGLPHSALPPPSRTVQVEYRGHVERRGDTEWVRQPAECGSVGEGRRLEGFTLRLRGNAEQVGLRYRAHLAVSGDTPWCATNELCGTTGRQRRLEALWIEVTEGADRYDVYYSAYLARFGWTGWFKNGEMCGTRGEYRQVEAIRVFLAEKSNERTAT